MTCAKAVIWVVLAGLTFVMPWSGGAFDVQRGKPLRQIVASPMPHLAAADDMPIYKPPPRGAPGGRVGGSSRGPGDGLPGLAVLAPDHTGLTTQEQPSLHWYLSTSTTYPVEVTIIDDQTIQPLLEKRLGGPIQPGVQRVKLADYGLRLSPGVLYRWSVALVVDADNRSRDILAGGFIQRIALPETLPANLARAGMAQTPKIYAEAGLWYDALTAISDLIDSSPHAAALRQQRAALLKQVGLSEIAEHDMRRSRAQ